MVWAAITDDRALGIGAAGVNGFLIAGIGAACVAVSGRTLATNTAASNPRLIEGIGGGYKNWYGAWANPATVSCYVLYISIYSTYTAVPSFIKDHFERWMIDNEQERTVLYGAVGVQLGRQ